MTALSATQITALRGVIEMAPDAAVERLERSLREDPKGLAPVRELVQAEGEDRRARTAVFAPLLPLCGPAGAAPRTLDLPRDLPARLWRGLKLADPRKVEAAVIMSQRLTPPDGGGAPIFDGLCRAAAQGLRAHANAEFAAAAEALDAGRAGDAELVARLLDIAPIARSALQRLPEWLNHMNEDAAAAARLAFKDATEVAEDGGLRLMEVLFAHMGEPSRILRLVSAVMDRPGESYVAASELSGFGDRVLEDIDARIAEVMALDPEAGPDAGQKAGQAASTAVSQFIEFERGVDLARNGPWGQRIGKQKRALAAAVESRLKQAVRAAGEALPLKSKARGAVRGMPNLANPPEPRLVRRALTLLAFMDAIRAAAAAGGFGRPRAEAAEGLSAQIDLYVEDLLDTLHAGDVEVEPRARAYLAIAADFLALVTDEKAAEVARRRAAAA